MATASSDQTAKIWDAATGSILHDLTGHEDIVSFAQFSPDGRSVVTGSPDKTARIWDLNLLKKEYRYKDHI